MLFILFSIFFNREPVGPSHSPSNHYEITRQKRQTNATKRQLACAITEKRQIACAITEKKTDSMCYHGKKTDSMCYHGKKTDSK